MQPNGSRLPSWFWGRYSRLGLTLALATVVVDQAHKWWMLAVYRLAEKDRVVVLPFLDWKLALNRGISYGMMTLDGATGQRLLASFAVATAIALAVWLAHGATNRLMALSLGLIIGGAVGNAIDRITVGGVIDYFSLHAFGFYWYIFNIADVAIVAGVAGLLYKSFWASRKAAVKVD